jgi:hypothetical protein
MIVRDSNVEVRSSAIQGAGVFALHNFRAGEVVRRVNLVREVTGAKPLGPAEDISHCMYAMGRVFFVGEPDRYLNHCCEPSAYKRFEPDGVTIVAMRDIAAGEEITLDYMINTHGGSSWPCLCGVAACRGQTVASFFDLPLTLQHRYLPYLADWFVRAYPDRIEALRRR